MKAPHPELDDDVATRLLVDALRTDGPSDAARARMRAALGISAVAAVTTSAAAAGAGSSAAGVGTTVVTTSVAPKAAAGLALAKWGALAVIGGAVAAGSGAAVLRASHRDASPQTSVVVVVAPPPPIAPRARPAIADDRKPDVAEPPLPAPPRSATSTTTTATTATHANAASRSSAQTAAPGAQRSLSDELATIDEARDALAAGRPQQALDALDRYEARFPRGALGPEAGVLRVDASLAAGRRDEARAAARRFADRYGDTPQTRRIDALLAAAGDAP